MQKETDDSNEQTAQIICALVFLIVVTICGMGCQFLACKRVCCYDPHKEKE